MPEIKLFNDRKIVGILQPGYLPWLGFFEQLYQSDTFILYDDVQFEKGSWRNRNRIKTVTGPQWLTVPVRLKGEKNQLIRDVVINSSDPWQKKHINSIVQNYSKSPYFEHYSQGLINCIDKPWKKLVDLDYELIFWLVAQLGIHTEIRLSSDLKISGNSVQRLIDMVQSLSGTHFYEGAAGINYIETKKFEQANISVIFQEYKHPVYSQLYGTFCSHLSIVDLLFNCGPESLGVLTNNKMKGNI